MEFATLNIFIQFPKKNELEPMLGTLFAS